MLCESEERMVVVVRREHEDDVRRHFQRWELHCAVVGVVTDDGMATVRDSSTSLTAGGEDVAARLPVALLTDPPQYVREGVKPRWLDELQSYDLSALPDVTDL